MIAGRFRFHGYGSLKFLYHKGETHRSRSVSLRVVNNPRREESRVAVVVTKKVQKAAPRRNRIRRRVYEIVRTNWEHIKPGHDILISIYDPQAGVMPYDELEQTVVGVLKQAGVWQDSQVDDDAR
ncbi:MAG TPA: ribonuclease P protein component [Candidatus Saccharimonadales bacterium]|nr:ribonuclease P protein component [Candidatus Saccharimonadales bacterium]